MNPWQELISKYARIWLERPPEVPVEDFATWLWRNLLREAVELRARLELQ